jgi:hypothetical protein
MAAVVSSLKRGQCIAVTAKVLRASAGNMGRAEGCACSPAGWGVLPYSQRPSTIWQCLRAKFCFQAYLQKYPNKLFLIDAMIHLYLSARILFFVTIEIIMILKTMVRNYEGYSRHRPHGPCRAL